MKFLIVLSLVAFAAAVPLDFTAEVAEATKQHLAAHAAASAGEHAKLAPVQGPALYLADAFDVAAAKPYLPDAADVAAAKPYLADAADVAAAKPYLLDTADVAAAKPYLADAVDVAAAKVEFQKYFDAAKAGVPLTPVTLPAAKVVAPVITAPIISYAAHLPHLAYNPLGYGYGAYPYWGGYAGFPYYTLPVVAAPEVTAAKTDEMIKEE